MYGDEKEHKKSTGVVKHKVETFDMGLSLLYLNFLLSMIMDVNSFLPLFGISAKSLLNK